MQKIDDLTEKRSKLWKSTVGEDNELVLSQIKAQLSEIDKEIISLRNNLSEK
jgi:hypothetical protein